VALRAVLVRCWRRRLHDGADGRPARLPGQGAGRRQRGSRHLLQGRAAQAPDRWEYLAAQRVGTGGVPGPAAKGPAPVWKVKRSPTGVITSLEKRIEYASHYSSTIIPMEGGYLR